MRRALNQLAEGEWERADLLLISDGQFRVPRELLAQVGTAREEHDARLHGILIGSRDHGPMDDLCDPLHVFSEWTGVVEAASRS